MCSYLDITIAVDQMIGGGYRSTAGLYISMWRVTLAYEEVTMWLRMSSCEELVGKPRSCGMTGFEHICCDK